MKARLNIARLLLLLGITIGMLSWKESIGHVGNLNFLVPAYSLGATHSWYHVFREACGDVAKLTVFLILFFGRSAWRTPQTWWIALVLMVGYYAPFWIGTPFQAALSAPNRQAEAVHVGMALFALGGLLIAWPCFRRKAFD